MTSVRLILCACLLAVSQMRVRAQDTTPLSRTTRSILQAQHEAAVLPGGFNKADHLTGDWFGYRDRWQDSGVEVFGFYNSIVSGNARGGRDPGHASYDDDIWLGMKFDLEKLMNWRGGQFVVSGVNRDGEDLTTRHIGSIYSTQQLVGGQRPFLYQLYLQQKITKTLTAKVGRFGASDDFNTSPLYGYSLNNGINGNIRNVLFDTRFSAYPFATWAGALFYDPTPEFNLKLGVFQVSQDMFDNNMHGVDFSIRGSDGYLLIAQFGWTPQFFQRAAQPDGKDEKALTAPRQEATVAPALKGLPGHYWIGLTYSSWDGYRRFGGGTEDRSYGFYANADQMIYQERPGSDEGLTAFVATGYYPQKAIAIVPFQLNAGLNYKGLFPHRKDDRTLLYFIYGDISSDYAASVRRPGGGAARSEEVIELAHRFQITPWSYFQPDLQYVVTPGGTGDIPDAVVIGAQMGLTF